MLTEVEKVEVLTAIYTKPYTRIAITFFTDETVEFFGTGLSNLGDENEQDLVLQSLVAAGGANVAGWDCKIS
jgi:hypothetical protein